MNTSHAVFSFHYDDSLNSLGNIWNILRLNKKYATFPHLKPFQAQSCSHLLSCWWFCLILWDILIHKSSEVLHLKIYFSCYFVTWAKIKPFAFFFKKKSEGSNHTRHVVAVCAIGCVAMVCEQLFNCIWTCHWRKDTAVIV